MSYTRLKTVDFGPLQTGLATVGYSLDGTVWTTSGVSEVVSGSGAYQASIVFADGFRGVLRWRTGPTSPIFAFEEINPESAEIPSQVWSNSTRSLTAFGFTVSASLSGSPVFRNQDAITTPTYDDCLASAWAASNAKEVENDSAKTFLRYMPNGTDLMRSFTLTTDVRGNPVGRH